MAMDVVSIQYSRYVEAITNKRIDTFAWVNAEGKRNYIKYTFKKKGGQKVNQPPHELQREDANTSQFMSFEDVQKYSGIDPDYSKRDMYNAIENGISGKGDFPECEFTC